MMAINLYINEIAFIEKLWIIDLNHIGINGVIPF